VRCTQCDKWAGGDGDAAGVSVIMHGRNPECCNMIFTRAAPGPLAEGSGTAGLVSSLCRFPPGPDLRGRPMRGCPWLRWPAGRARLRAHSRALHCCDICVAVTYFGSVVLLAPACTSAGWRAMRRGNTWGRKAVYALAGTSSCQSAQLGEYRGLEGVGEAALPHARRLRRAWSARTGVNFLPNEI